jgi:hypothetical protein
MVVWLLRPYCLATSVAHIEVGEAFAAHAQGGMALHAGGVRRTGVGSPAGVWGRSRPQMRSITHDWAEMASWAGERVGANSPAKLYATPRQQSIDDGVVYSGSHGAIEIRVYARNREVTPMDDQLQKINARLQHYNRDQLQALIWDFLSDRDEEDLADFLDLMRQKSRPAVVETLEMEDATELLEGIQELHDAIANDEYVQYGAGYDPDYGDYRGFGDDSWIDEMDSLFAATTSLYREGNYRTAASGYIALFDIFKPTSRS